MFTYAVVLGPTSGSKLSWALERQLRRMGPESYTVSEVKHMPLQHKALPVHGVLGGGAGQQCGLIQKS